MGNINSTGSTSIKKYNFENMQVARMSKGSTIIINTLPEDLQDCIIPGTINIKDEVSTLNNFLSQNKATQIVVYGLNSHDEKAFSKYLQLTQLGFTNIFIYVGGMFEWLLLQEIYGDENFPTTSKQLDILKYK